MENLDIYVLTSITATLFTVFFITIYREFNRMEYEGYQSNPYAKKYGRDALFDFAAKFFEDEQIITNINKKEKKIIYKAMFKNIADMESDGVYFPEDIKREIVKQKQELSN